MNSKSLYAVRVNDGGESHVFVYPTPELAGDALGLFVRSGYTATLVQS